MRFFRFEMTRNTEHEYCHAVSLATLMKSENFSDVLEESRDDPVYISS